MDQGKVIACGTNQELIQIVGEMDRIELTLSSECEPVVERWQRTPGVHRLISEDGHLTLLVDDSNSVLPRLFESAAQVGVRIASVDIQVPNLEAVFLHLTGKALRDGSQFN